MGFAMGLTGHTCGVRVLKMDRPAAGGFLGLTAFQAEGCGLPLYGAQRTHFEGALATRKM